MNPKLSSLLVKILLLLLPTSSFAVVTVPEEVQIPIFLKILNHDRNLTPRAGEEVHIGVVYSDPEDPSCRKNLTKVTEALRENEKTKVRGLPISFSVLEYSSAERLREQLKQQEIDIVYLTSGQRERLPEVVRVTRQLKILSLAAEVIYLKSGAAVGLHQVGKHPRIFIGLKAARQEGAFFSAQLLKLCKIVGE